MIRKDLQNRISLAVKSEEISLEICNRLEVRTPKNREEAANVLGKLNPDLNDQILKGLRIGLGNYDHGECGDEIAKKLNGCVKVLQVFVKNESLEEVKEEMGNDLMSKITFEALTLGLNSINAAEDFEKIYDIMVASVQNIEGSNQFTGSFFDDFLIEEGIMDEVKERTINKTQKFIRKRIRLKKT